SNSMADYIRDVFMGGVQRGASNEEIAGELYDDIPDFSRNRAATIARTETHGAALWAIDQTIDEKQIEIVTKVWYTAQDARVRESHAAMHGVEIPRDDPFETDDGDMMYPGDDSLGADPGGIINCRCSVLYNTAEPTVLPGAESESEE